MAVPKEAEEDFEFEDSTFEINSPAVAKKMSLLTTKRKPFIRIF